MGDIAETVIRAVPGEGAQVIYFTATKVSQNDTITFSDYRQVLCAFADVFYSTNAGTADTVTVDYTTINKINLTGSTTGTIKGIAVVVR